MKPPPPKISFDLCSNSLLFKLIILKYAQLKTNEQHIMEQQFLYLYFTLGHQARLGQDGQSLGAGPAERDLLRMEEFLAGHMRMQAGERLNLRKCLEWSVS